MIIKTNIFEMTCTGKLCTIRAGMCIKQSILFYVEQVNTPVEDYT